MSHWNLRVIENKKDLKNIYCFVAEVYYNEDGEYQGYAHDEGVNLLGDNYDDLKDYYEMCAEAFRHPVIQIEEFEDEDDI